MPRDSGGTYTLPAGNPVVSGTTISSTVHNNTMDDLADEMTDSLSRSGEGGMLAALELVDGTQAAPGLSFNNETSTGLYRAGTDDLQVSVTNQSVMQWTNNLVRALNDLYIRDPSADDPALYMEDSAGNDLASLIHLGTTALRLTSLEHGIPFQIRGEDAGGSLQQIFEGDADDLVRLFFAGSQRLATTGIGIVIDATDGTLQLRDGDLEIGFLQKASGGGFNIRNTEHGANVNLQAEDLSGNLENLLVGDPDGALTIYNAGEARFRTDGTRGVEILGAALNESAITFRDSSFATIGFLGFVAGDAFQVRNSKDGESVFLYADDSGGSNGFLYSGDPDGAAILYHDHTTSYSTLSTGGALRGTASITEHILQDSGGTQVAQMRWDGGSGVQVRGREHGSWMSLQAEDNGGTLQNLYFADPDGGAQIYHAGDSKILTRGDGATISNTDGGAGATVIFQMDDGDSESLRLAKQGNGPVSLRNFEHSGEVSFQGEDSGGTLTVLMDGDPDGESRLFHDGTAALRTTADGVRVDPVSGNGFIRIFDGPGNSSIIGRLSGSYSFLRSEDHGEAVRLEGEDAGGSISAIVVGDPDGTCTLYWDGGGALRTANRNATDSNSGAEVTDGTNVWRNVGFNIQPILTVNGNFTIFRERSGYLYHATSGTLTATINATTNSAPDGATWTIFNDSGNDLTVATSGGPALTWADGSGGATGNRTVADGGFVCIMKLADNDYLLTGNGIT